MSYRCVATSVAGFVQQLAVCYVARGYCFYVTGRIPERKDPARIDAKLIAQYDLDVSKWTRARRRKGGQASVQYLRCGRFFVIVATHGEHSLFTAEGGQIYDFRKRPLHFMGYAIGCRRARGGGVWHASVRIQREVCAELKADFARLAVHRSVEKLGCELRAIPYEPYAPVRDQLRGLLRAVNRRRQAAGLEFVPRGALRLRRVLVKPFG
jgi:hypothetical protein